MSDIHELQLRLSVYRQWTPPLPAKFDRYVLIRLRGMGKPKNIAKLTTDDIRQAIVIRRDDSDLWRNLNGIVVPERVSSGKDVLTIPRLPIEDEEGYQQTSAPREVLVLRGSLSLDQIDDTHLVAMVEAIQEAILTDE